MQRSRSAQDRPFQRQNDELYRDQGRQNKFRRANSSYRYRQTCRNCGREHGKKRYNYRYQCPRCHQYPDNLSELRHRKNSSSSLCSLAQHDELTESLGGSDRFGENQTTRRRNRPPMPLPSQTHWSDHESDYWSGFAPPPPLSTNSEHNYTNINTNERAKNTTAPALPTRGKKTEPPLEDISLRSPPQKFKDSPQGFSIPQQIIIPPIPNDGTLDSQRERQYRINSEIIISYDQPPRVNNLPSQTIQFSSPQQSEITTIYSPQLKTNKENKSLKEKVPIPMERRSLKSAIDNTRQLPMALTSTV